MMLVRFYSSETGELLMFAEAAKTLFQMMGKESSARGSFAQPEMQAAAAALRQAVHNEPPGPAESDEDEEHPVARPVTLNSRAWPLIDMLERTGRAGPKANIIWEAPSAF